VRELGMDVSSSAELDRVYEGALARAAKLANPA
jgi:hypothetical protein